MKRTWVLWVGLTLTLASGCDLKQPVKSASQSAAVAAEPASGSSTGKVRPATVAGSFYPAEPNELTAKLDAMLAEAKRLDIPKLRGLICPHAGYEYSGKVAASGYKQAADRDFDTVVVMAPTHYAAFSGAALTDAEGLATPLGTVKVSPKSRLLAQEAPFKINPPADVQRPAWASGPPTDGGPESPMTWEHSLEVQIPFLQRVLPKAEIVPVVFGEIDARLAARVLSRHLDDKSVVVASSDLSHYHSYIQAVNLDQACIQAICRLDVGTVASQEACGKGPILVLMHLAKMKHWRTLLLDQRNSGDISGDKSRVVGYTAIAFFEPPPASTAAPPPLRQYDAAQRKTLLDLARQTVTQVVTTKKTPEAPRDLDAKLMQTRACFVTLKKNGELRGCIGSIFPQEPLGPAVIHMARGAAMEDGRFPPVTPEELASIDIEISALTVPEPLEFQSPEELLDKLRVKIDGVVLQVVGRQSTFLPQVWEELSDKEEFLGHLSRKAGLDEAAWRRPDAKVWTYQVEAFKEKESEPAGK